MSVAGQTQEYSKGYEKLQKPVNSDTRFHMGIVINSSGASKLFRWIFKYLYEMKYCKHITIERLENKKELAKLKYLILQFEKLKIFC